ncbi:hypothetical protein [Nostoc sp.]
MSLFQCENLLEGEDSLAQPLVELLSTLPEAQGTLSVTHLHHC